MRPWRSTWVASTTTSAAPEFASMPRCMRCQSLAQPSSAEYWHIGETTMRLASSRPASLRGEKRALLMGSHNSGWERRGVRFWEFGSGLLDGLQKGNDATNVVGVKLE